jgi:hypothetical protein
VFPFTFRTLATVVVFPLTFRTLATAVRMPPCRGPLLGPTSYRNMRARLFGNRAAEIQADNMRLWNGTFRTPHEAARA